MNPIKAFVRFVIGLNLIAYLIVLIVALTASSCSKYTCPTYSNVSNTKAYHKNYNKVKNQPNYYATKKFKY